MPLTLTVTDNENGTGATATIAGSDPAQTVTVFVSPHSGGISPVWTLAGSRSGDGTLALPVNPAYWFGYALGTVGGAPAVSVPTVFLASRSGQALLDLILDGVQARIQTLSL